MLFVFSLSISAAEVCTHENKRVTAIEYADFAQNGTMRFVCPGCTVTEKTVTPLIKLNGYSVPTADSELCVGYTINREVANELKKLNKSFDLGLVVAAKSGLGNEMPLNNATAEPFSEKCIKLSLLGITTDAVDFRLTDFDASTIIEPLYFTAYSYDGNQVKYVSGKTDNKPIEVVQAVVQKSEDVKIADQLYFSIFKPESTIANDRLKQTNNSNADYNKGTNYTQSQLDSIKSETNIITNLITSLAFPNASEYMTYYLKNSGADKKIDMGTGRKGFFKSDDTKAHRITRITQAMRAAEQLAIEGYEINVYQKGESVNAFSNEMDDWYLSVGSYFTCVNMLNLNVKTGADGKKVYTATVEYNVADFYNWDEAKTWRQFKDQLPSQYDLHQLHRAGMAKEFTSYGQATYNITWTEGQNADQISGIK